VKKKNFVFHRKQEKIFRTELKYFFLCRLMLLFGMLVVVDGCSRLGAMLACKSLDSLGDTLKTVPEFRGRVHIFGDVADFNRVEAWMVPRVTSLTSGPLVTCRGRVPPGLLIHDVQCRDRTFYSEEFVPLGK
jgi:hypothetical protein